MVLFSALYESCDYDVVDPKMTDGINIMEKEYYFVATKYSKDGWKYYSEKEVESDGHNAKIWHYVITPTGTVLDMDYSPYQYPTNEHIEQFIEAYIDMQSKMADDLDSV